MPLIECRDLSFGYDRKAVVDGLSFTLSEGDYLCVVGENGSGKSTLLKTLLHIQAPLSGQIIFDKSLSQTKIGYLPQQTQLQRDFPASVREIVLSGCLGRGSHCPFYTSSQKKRAAECMDKLHISHLSGRCYRELSGGQQQRVLLARALCAAEKLLILDEPTAGLDPQVTKELYHLISSLNQEGMTILMITHDLSAAMTYATHILHIGATPLFFGSKDEYGSLFFDSAREKQ